MRIDPSDIPEVLSCPKCGEYIRDINQATGFEIFTGRVLQARIAPDLNEGFDLYDSKLFPDLTFQVKYANARKGTTETRVIDGRSCTFKQSPIWSWLEPHALGANWYILFGIKREQVYPFAVPVWIWEDESYDTGNGGRILTISTDEYSKCGRYASSYKRNKFWQYHLQSWPEDLFEAIKFYSKRGPMEQLSLYEEIERYKAGRHEATADQNNLS